MQYIKKRVMYKVARAYYVDELTQQEIGKKYSISRIMVSRMLKKAIQEKMVEIKIHPPENFSTDLEKLLENKFNLQEVVVVPCTPVNYSDVIREVGAMAAMWFIETLEGTETISLSWGKTLLSFINGLPSINHPNLKVVQMIGGLGEPEADVHGADLTRKLAQVFHVKPRMLSSPGIVSSKSVCDALKSEFQISETLKMAARSDIALIGIGAFDETSPIFTTDIILSQPDRERLIRKGAVGDISLRYFNKDGKMIDDEINDRIVGLDAEEIICIPRRIAIAGGTNKFKPLLAALKGNLVNTLVTDHFNAQKLLDSEV